MAILAASIGFGYRIGRDQPSGGEPTALPASTTGTTVTAPSTTIVAESPFPTDTFSFAHRTIGHHLPDGTTEYHNPNMIDDLAVDPDGNLWSVGPGGIVEWRHTNGSPVVRSVTTSPSGGEAITIAPNGDVWVADGSTIYRWDGTGWADARIPATSKYGRAIDAEITALAASGDNELWVATMSYPDGRNGDSAPVFRLHHFEHDVIGEVPTVRTDGFVYRLVAGPDGSTWALMEGGLWKLHDGAWSRVDAGATWISDVAPSGDSVWIAADGHLTRSTTDASEGGGELWYPPDSASTTEAIGVAVGPDAQVWAVAATWQEQGPETFELVSVEDQVRYPIPASTITARPVITPDGVVWLGTEAGIVGFDGSEWTHLRVADAPPIHRATSMAVDADGVVWIADDGSFLRFDGFAWATIDPSELGLAPPEPTDDPWWNPLWIAGSDDGTHLIAARGCSLAARIDESWERMETIEVPAWGQCWPGNAAVADGAVYLASPTTGSQVSRTDVRGTTELPVGPGYVISLAVAADGTVWAATEDAVWSYEGSDWEPSLRGVTLEHLAVLDDGTIAGSESRWDSPLGESSLWRYDGEAWERDRRIRGITTITAGLNGAIWAIGEDLVVGEGVWQFGPTTGSRLVYRSSGLDLLDVGPDGTVWAAGPGRLVRIEP